MNTFYKALLSALLLLAINSVAAKSSSNQQKKVDAKCFVELVGGGETIAFFNISEKKLVSLSKSIIGRKVTALGQKQKVKIYNAHECVLLKDNFKSSSAKIVDAKTAR